MRIQYLKGDATSPVGSDHKIIAHICNDLGKWGRGFVLAISKRWKEPEKAYKDSFRTERRPVLGDVQLIQITGSLTVANIIGQHGIQSSKNMNMRAPIRYSAVSNGLNKIAKYAIENDASVHMPRIGCGLAGGSWEKIEPIIYETLITNDIGVFVYDL